MEILSAVVEHAPMIFNSHFSVKVRIDLNFPTQKKPMTRKIRKKLRFWSGHWRDAGFNCQTDRRDCRIQVSLQWLICWSQNFNKEMTKAQNEEKVSQADYEVWEESQLKSVLLTQNQSLRKECSKSKCGRGSGDAEVEARPTNNHYQRS